MKKGISLLFVLLCATLMHAQNNINQLLAAGLHDAKEFSKAYIDPASSGLIYAMSNGWYNTAKAKNLGQFEISFIGNAGFVDDDSKSFQLNTADYEFLRFEDPAINQMEVATVFGKNRPDIEMLIKFETPAGTTEQTEITLPQGLGSSVSAIPSGYLQVSAGILKGTEVKLRFLPKISIKDVSSNFYGAALQHEVTSWIPGAKHFPLHISALIGYSRFKGHYNLEDNQITEGESQKIQTRVDSWLFSAIASTDWKVINFYGAIGYLTGKSTTDLKGTYRIKDGILSGQSITDPYSLTQHANGMKATLGCKLTLGFFRINADYSFQEFDTVSVGLHFGI